MFWNWRYIEGFHRRKRAKPDYKSQKDIETYVVGDHWQLNQTETSPLKYRHCTLGHFDYLFLSFSPDTGFCFFRWLWTCLIYLFLLQNAPWWPNPTLVTSKNTKKYAGTRFSCYAITSRVTQTTLLPCYQLKPHLLNRPNTSTAGDLTQFSRPTSGHLLTTPACITSLREAVNFVDVRPKDGCGRRSKSICNGTLCHRGNA